MSWVSEGDRDCRYVPEHPAIGSFSRMLQTLGIKLPSGVTVQHLVRWGWIAPVLRVRIPSPYLEGWATFPSLGKGRLIRAEDKWIDDLWHRTFMHVPENPTAPWTRQWFVHRLDRARDPLARAVREHALPLERDAPLPPPVKLPSGRTAQPWLDYFSEWQALQVFDLIRAAPLHAPILNTPNARQEARGVLKHLGLLREMADADRRGVALRWSKARPVLDWVYQYRTLLGIWLGRHGRRSRIGSGARALATRLGISSDALRDGIRDVLLVLWSHLDHAGLPPKAREQFRQDIYWATDFLGHLTGRRIDPYDPFWDPPDPNAREWERLRAVLPFELDEARHELPRLAGYYLERFHSVASARRRYDEARIHRLTEEWWPKSYAFRRFGLSLLRLQRHYGGAVNREHRIMLTEETPIEFLLLLTLAVEKLLAERYFATQGPSEHPDFSALVRARAEVVGNAWRLHALKGRVDTRLKRDKKSGTLETQLRDLTLKGKSRGLFRQARKGSLTGYMADTFVTFAQLRNYAAHHDKLDYELIHTKTGSVALESLLLVAFVTLDP